MVKQKTEPVRLPKRIVLQLKRLKRKDNARSIAQFLQDKKVVIKKLR